jgi:hypothetical protein
MDPQFQELLARLLMALAPFPEAREAVAAMLSEEESPTRQIELIPLRTCDDQLPNVLSSHPETDPSDRRPPTR